MRRILILALVVACSTFTLVSCTEEAVSPQTEQAGGGGGGGGSCSGCVGGGGSGGPI